MPERLLTINIRKYLVNQPRTKRAKKAAAYVRERVAHYTKIPEENVKIGYDLNNLIFKHYAKSMVPLKLRIKIGTDTADVLPFKEDAAPVPEEKGKEKKVSIEKKQEKQEKPAAAAQPASATKPTQKVEKAQQQKAAAAEQKPQK